MSKLRIAKVQIIDTLGIRELEFDAGNWNEITGANGEGKTSVLDAIKSVFEGGNDATLIYSKDGETAERSEIVLVLNDNTTIRKRTTAKTTDVRVERDGVRAPKPQETINSLLDMFSVNPVAFLNAPAKKRVNVLLETLPMPVNAEEIRDLVKMPELPITEGAHALEEIDRVHALVFGERRETNRAVREKEASITQLAATLPSETDVASGNEEELKAQIAEVDAAKEAEDQRIDAKLGTLKAEFEARVDALRETIASLQAQIAEATNKVAAEREAYTIMEGRAATQRAAKTAAWRDARQPLIDAFNLLQSNRDAVVRAKTTRETMKAFRSEADKLEADSKRQSKVLTDLEAYKAKLLENLPGGLTVQDGELMHAGVPFDRLNKAKQVEIAIELAKLRAGDLGVVCIDEFEMMDSAHRAELIKQGAASGLQFFITRVSDEPLAITSH